MAWWRLRARRCALGRSAHLGKRSAHLGKRSAPGWPTVMELLAFTQKRIVGWRVLESTFFVARAYLELPGVGVPHFEV